MGSIISRVVSNARFLSNAAKQSQSMVNVLPKEEQESKKVDYLHLPCPFPYHDIQSEANGILKPTMFEGLRCCLLSRVNRIGDKFLIINKVVMEQLEIPFYAPQIRKISSQDYEFGVSYTAPKLLLVGKIDTHGTLKGRVQFNLADRFFCDMNGDLTREIDWSYGKLLFDYKGNAFQSRFQVETDKSCSASYIQSVTPNLSLGTKLLWLGDQTKSTIAFAARYSTNKVKAAGEVSTDGSILLSYVQNLSKKASLASSFQYQNAAYAISSFGYQYKFREAVVRGKVNSDGVVSSHVMRKIGTKGRLFLIAEIHQVNQNYKLGYGLEWGVLPAFPNESGILK